MIEYINKNYYADTINFVKHVKNVLTEEVIDNIIDQYSKYLSINKCKVLKKYLKEKIRRLLNIYNI